MAIYIKGAYKPVNCQLCIKSRLANAIKCKARDNTTSLQRAFSTAEDCPIVYIYEPHGRLIDENTIMEAYCKRVVHKNGEFKFPMVRIVGTDAPTVIEESE